MSLLGRIFAQINPFDNGATYSHPAAPQPAPRMVNLQQLHNALQVANQPNNQQISVNNQPAPQHIFLPPPALPSLPSSWSTAPQFHPSLAPPSITHQALGVLRNQLLPAPQQVNAKVNQVKQAPGELAQNYIFRPAARAGISAESAVAQALGKPQTPYLVPQNIPGGTKLFGNTPIQSYQQESGQHGGKLAGLGAVGLSAVSDLPIGPGKAGKLAKGTSLPQDAKVLKKGLVLVAGDLGAAGQGAIDTSLAKSGSKSRPGQIVPNKSPQALGNLESSSKTSTRSFPKTVRGSQAVQASTPITPDQLNKIFKNIPYFKQIQKPVLAQAHENIKGNPIKILNEVLSPTARPTSQHIARGTILLADALRRGDAPLAENISKSLSAKGTGLGQAVSMFNTINRTTPSGAFHWATQLGADSATAENFYKRALEVEKMATGKTQDIARFRLAEDMARLDPSSVAKQGVELWRSLLLTGPRTHAGNLVSNTIEAATKQGLVNPLATGIDKAVSLVTGKRSRGLAVRGLGAGTKEGLSNAKTYIKTGYNPLNASGKYEAGQTVFGKGRFGKIAKGISQPVYRVLGAADQPYRLAARQQALAEQAKAAALNKGLKGQAKQDFIKQFLAKPPKSAVEHSIDIGDRSVFGNKTILSQIASSAKRPVVIKGKQVYSGAVGQFVVPFTQVPSSIATRIVERSPLGFASAAKDLVNAAKGKGFDQYMFTEKLANATVGTGASLVVGKELANHNMITLGYPTDPKEKELWKQEGKQPYSVKVGGKWLSLNYVQPFGSMLAWGAAYQTARKNGDSVDKAVTQAAAQAGKAVASQSFLQGVSGALGAVQDPAQNAAKYVKSAAQSLVPGLARTTAIATDPLQREVNNPGQAVRAGIPIWRRGLPTKQDNFGNDLPSGNTNVISDLNAAINPLKPSTARATSPVTPELRRLQDSKQGIVPITIATDSLGKGTALDANQQRQLQQMYGQGVQEAWKQAVQDPRYKNLSDEAKKKVLSGISDNVLLAAKGQFAANNNLTVPKQNTASKLILQGKNVDPFNKINTQTTPADKYQNALDTFNANQSSYTDAKRISAQSSLSKLKVESGYSQNVVDLYGLSKAKIYQYITTNPQGKDIANQLQKLDQQLYDSKVSASLKFKSGFAPKVSTGSSRRTSGSRAKVATLKAKLPPKPKGLKIGRLPTVSKVKQVGFRMPKSTVAKKARIKVNFG